MKYKLIALDLDGTLKNSSNKVSARTKKALMKAQKQGAKIVLASGRPTHGLRKECDLLDLEKYEGYLLSYNGAKVSTVKSKITIFEQTLSVEQVRQAYDRSKEFSLSCLTYDGPYVVSENVDDHYVQYEYGINDMNGKEIDSFKDYVKEPVNKVLLTGEPDYVGSILEDFKAPFGDKLSIYRSAPFFVEIMAQGINKAASLDRLVKHMGITCEEVIAFGDGYNDLSMIEYAGMGVSMANGVDEIKEKADFVTLSNDEDGIAYALEKFLF